MWPTDVLICAVHSPATTHAPTPARFIQLLPDVQEVPHERTEAAFSAADEALGGDSASARPLSFRQISPRDAQAFVGQSSGSNERIPTRRVGDSGSLDDDSAAPAPVGGFANDVAVKPVGSAGSRPPLPGMRPPDLTASMPHVVFTVLAVNAGGPSTVIAPGLDPTQICISTWCGSESSGSKPALL